jgi:hypothetical protein
MLLRVTGTLITLLLLAGAGYYTYEQQEPVCDICHRPIHQASAYLIELDTGEVVKACCPRCGLRFQEGIGEAAGVEVADFTSGTLVDANDAFYVEDSTITLCLSQDVLHKDATGGQYGLSLDRCMPSLIGFRTRADAVAFARENGGAIRT